MIKSGSTHPSLFFFFFFRTVNGERMIYSSIMVMSVFNLLSPKVIWFDLFNHIKFTHTVVVGVTNDRPWTVSCAKDNSATQINGILTVDVTQQFKYVVPAELHRDMQCCVSLWNRKGRNCLAFVHAEISCVKLCETNVTIFLFQRPRYRTNN